MVTHAIPTKPGWVDGRLPLTIFAATASRGVNGRAEPALDGASITASILRR